MPSDPHAMVAPLLSNEFFHDGRGPELQRVHWTNRGRVLVAIDYQNPGFAGSESLRHVRFAGVQVVMTTPDEVVDPRRFAEHFARFRPAAMLDLGRSSWLDSFHPQHLVKCRHLHMMFYDECIDVICEGVSCHAGGFGGS